MNATQIFIRLINQPWKTNGLNIRTNINWLCSKWKNSTCQNSYFNNNINNMIKATISKMSELPEYSNAVTLDYSIMINSVNNKSLFTLASLIAGRLENIRTERKRRRSHLLLWIVSSWKVCFQLVPVVTVSAVLLKEMSCRLRRQVAEKTTEQTQIAINQVTCASYLWLVIYLFVFFSRSVFWHWVCFPVSVVLLSWQHHLRYTVDGVKELELGLHSHRLRKNNSIRTIG